MTDDCHEGARGPANATHCSLRMMAGRAWMDLAGDAAIPRRIEPITEGHRIWVYVLVGAGPGGKPVIAKRTCAGTVDLERRIYEEILCDAPLTSLAFYGSAKDPDPDFGWLFLEHAGEDRYSATNESHRRSMARWLARLHVHASRTRRDAGPLPDRGPAHYLARLRAVQAKVRSRACDADLPGDHRRLLERVATRFDGIEAAWSSFEEICERFPRTLVHGDLSAKNVRIRSTATPTDIVTFDWEMAGWGSPAPDLGQLEIGAPGSLVAPDLPTYAAALDPEWSRHGERQLRALAAVGSIFRVVALIDWMVWSIAPGMPGWAMPTMAVYDEILGRIIHSHDYRSHES